MDEDWPRDRVPAGAGSSTISTSEKILPHISRYSFLSVGQFFLDFSPKTPLISGVPRNL